GTNTLLVFQHTCPPQGMVNNLGMEMLPFLKTTFKVEEIFRLCVSIVYSVHCEFMDSNAIGQYCQIKVKSMVTGGGVARDTLPNAGLSKVAISVCRARATN